MAEPKTKITQINTPQVNAELIYFQLAQIQNQLISFEKNYVTKAESQALKHEIAGLRAELKESNEETKQQIAAVNAESNKQIAILKKKSAFQTFLYPTLASGFTAVFTYLLIEAIRNK